MSDGIDVGALVARISDHRFDGYSYNMLADEVQAFRNGDGIGGISSAVDALKAVAGALDETDGTLRDQLGKLGVVWTSTAGGQAGVVLAEHAGFSHDATTKVNHAAEMIFAQGEAFNRTLHRLPETAALRTGAGSEGYSFGDSVAGLFGFETDHANAVRQANEARQQTVDALNEYARSSGENLASTEEIGRPETLGLRGSGGPFTNLVAADPGSGDDPVLPQGGGGAPAGGGPVPPPSPGSPAPHGGGASGGPVITPVGLPPAAPDQTTRPTGRVPHAPRPGQEPPSGSASGSGPVARAPIPDGRGQVRPPAVNPPAQPGFAGGLVTGPTVPESRAAGPRTPSAGRTGGPGGGGVPGGGTRGGSAPGGGEAPSGHAASGGPALAKGRVVGSVPQPPVTALSTGAPFSTVPRAAFGGAELGAGITALGAAGAGGAVSGEPDRQGKGFARSAPSRSAKAAKQIPMDDLPEEEAKVLRKSGHGTEQQPAKRGLLERAAERDAEDGKQVRRFGVDDNDLFTDQREVPPGTIARGDESRG
ncbi:hypothetical protein [Amycolatopsis sp. CA-230715]|uniref:hypothetical protein n=1 Tax=Amycolatopsis sp. CA-230715 TaxID=2745196 RepID=UPI001C02E71E|nr:hypothetical protein [Amycolatopsis sp. CA-230715]QWF80822.1 hypothetical protein HUW46_04246 [Amycolatopsis sp. CA-230715]